MSGPVPACCCSLGRFGIAGVWMIRSVYIVLKSKNFVGKISKEHKTTLI